MKTATNTGPLECDVGRLRAMVQWAYPQDAPTLLAAADEIERLREIADEQRRTIGALMIGCEDGTTSVLVRMARQDAEIERLQREVRVLLDAGGPLSNCAFNLSQRNCGQFTARDIESLDKCRKDWDDALRMVQPPNAALSGPAPAAE